MHSSPRDPLNTFRPWSKAETYQATRQGDWTPEDNLYVDYQAHAEAAGIAPSDRLSRDAFREELRCLCGRLPEKRKVRALGSNQPRYADCWPRALRAPARLFAAVA